MKTQYGVIVVGSGAAGFACANYLYEFGVKDVCVVTENVNAGTSRNTGSDKQTYYKLDICSDGGDSVIKMAQDLVRGGCMNGSDALIEAANSVKCFMDLVALGVPFPTDRFGRFEGYRTDHDQTARATSAGPLTSKYMTEALENKVRKNGTPILDGCRVIKLITDENACRGVVCLTDKSLINLYAHAVVLCTGAPAAIYAGSVYPESQTGATGLATEAGAELSNFQEWQYGIASVKFRWNLSGSYQQVVPTYYSVGADGEKHEFLTENSAPDEIYSLVFLKGYQWPFDSAKTQGSSRIDMLVFEELKKGRRVYLDYRKNPLGFNFDKLSEEAREYLTRAEALGSTPVERLKKLNPKALDLYLSHGIDLESEPLEIGLCAQHNNGGIRTDIHSRTNIKNLFCAGEAAGKFGVYRPGGCALNDTQVGALRAARYIAENTDNSQILTPGCTVDYPRISKNSTLAELKKRLPEKMSVCAGVIRDTEKLKDLFSELKSLDDDFYSAVTVSSADEYADFFAFRLTVKAMRALAATILESAGTIGSRGGSICRTDGKILPENTSYRNYVTVTRGDTVTFTPVDTIPDEHTVFEKLLKGKQP